MKEVKTTYYCDRCGKEMKCPSCYLKRKTIKFIGGGIDLEVCSECMTSFREWWKAGWNRR